MGRIFPFLHILIGKSECDDSKTECSGAPGSAEKREKMTVYIRVSCSCASSGLSYFLSKIVPDYSVCFMRPQSSEFSLFHSETTTMHQNQATRKSLVMP